MTTSPNQSRPSIDYDLHRDIAAKIRAEMMSNALSNGLSAIAPSRRAVRNFSLAFLLATGAFWLTMAQDPPKSVAADPSVGSSTLDVEIPSGLPSSPGGDAF